MEEFLQDKIFQFYYKKIYGKKSNYLSFKTFTDKDKVSFLINLYLYISNINNNTKNDFNSNNENEKFYKDNYNKIMNEYTCILNKYNNEFHSKTIINDNKKNNNNEELIKKEEKELNIDNNSNENQNQENNRIIINNEKNQIENNQLLKSKENNLIDNKEKKIKQSFQNQVEDENNNIEYEQNKAENVNSKNILENFSKSFDLQDNYNINKSLKQSNIINNKFQINMNLNNNQNIFKSGNLTSRNSTKTPNLKIVMKDINLTEKTLTEKSLAQLEEFTNDALVLINLMESKNDLETEIEEERKKNEIMIDKLKLDFEKQKNNIKLNCHKKETNIKKVLDDFEKEINNEKLLLNEEEKGYNLWDHIIIESQRTKEIKESIMKKLENIKN